jgi:hypothetical protein
VQQGELAEWDQVTLESLVNAFFGS